MLSKKINKLNENFQWEIVSIEWHFDVKNWIILHLETLTMNIVLDE